MPKSKKELALRKFFFMSWRKQEGDESGGLSELFRDVEADRPVVETGGVEVEAKPSGVEADKSDIINTTALTSAERLRQNNQYGHAFEEGQFALLKAGEYSNAQREVTIAAFDASGILGKNQRLDAIGMNDKGEILIQEYKSSATASFTKNQKEGFPNLINYGGIVKGKGKGKGIFKGGFTIDPKSTTVEVVRSGQIVN